MMNYRRVLSFVLTSAAIAGGIVACSAGAPEASESSSEALECSGRPCVKAPEPPPGPPRIPLQSCVEPNYECNGPGTNAAGVFDPVMIPRTGTTVGTAYVADPSFTASLAAAGCGVEHSFGTGSVVFWATAICPSAVSDSVTAYGAAHGDVVGVVPCTTCTPDPDLDQVVVAWLIGPGVTIQGCDDGGPDGEPSRCLQPGQGCKSITCLKS